jgi:hypothetical protein
MDTFETWGLWMSAAELRRTSSCGSFGYKEGTCMDAHFSEYLAAVRAMQEIYGERAENFPTEFHREAEQHAEAAACQGCLGV